MISIDDEFGFGKYKGFTVKDVWTGPTNNHQVLIKEYFTSFFEFLKTDYSQKTSFVLPTGNQSGGSRGDDSKKPNEPIGNFSVITTDNYLIIEASDVNSVDKIKCDIKETFSGQFLVAEHSKTTKGINGREVILPACLKICADPNYVQWCLKTIDHFCLSEDDIEKLETLECHFLTKINFSEVKPDILGFEPKYTTTRFKVRESVKKINSGKTERGIERTEYPSTKYDYQRDTFDALTDGQHGDFDDFDGDIGELRDSLGLS